MKHEKGRRLIEVYAFSRIADDLLNAFERMMIAIGLEGRG